MDDNTAAEEGADGDSGWTVVDSLLYWPPYLTWLIESDGRREWRISCSSSCLDCAGYWSKESSTTGATEDVYRLSLRHREMHAMVIRYRAAREPPHNSTTYNEIQSPFPV